MSLFRVPAGFGFEPTEPWTLQLLVQRATRPLDKASVNFGLRYTPPEPEVPEAPLASETQEGKAEALAGELAKPLWVRMWRANTLKIGVAAAAIGVLTASPTRSSPGAAGPISCRRR